VFPLAWAGTSVTPRRYPASEPLRVASSSRIGGFARAAARRPAGSASSPPSSNGVMLRPFPGADQQVLAPRIPPRVTSWPVS